jgi:peptide deformylase
MLQHREAIVKDEKELRRTSREVPISDIQSGKIQRVISSMSEALAKEEDGVAIAAPQIGEHIRLFIVSGRVLARIGRKKKGTDDSITVRDAVFINPVLLKSSQKKQTVEEGCLSLRYLYGKVRRAARVTIEARDEKGNKITRSASGLLAQIFQHEIDHLNGELFIDKATDLVDIPPTTNYKQDTKLQK